MVPLHINFNPPLLQNCNGAKQIIFYGVKLLTPCPPGFEFKVVFLLNWLQTKPRKFCLLCYFNHSRKKRWIHAFPKGISMR